jgi:hypothetical protein
MRYGRLNGDMRTIPYTFGRYLASTTWQIFDNYTQKVIYPDNNGNVSLIVDGGITLTKSLKWFVLISFKPINLPLNKALHFNYKIDSKYDSYDISKYVWYLDNPLESDHYPNFFIIPGYTRYLINVNGEVITSYGIGDLITPIKNIRNDYYKNIYMVDDYGKGSNESIHRLIAGTFLLIPANAPELVVNHIDLNTHNNSIQNLEWVSHNVNLAHAQLLYDNNVNAFIIKITKDGKLFEFTSLIKASEIIGIKPIDLWKAYSGKISVENLTVDITNADGTPIKGFELTSKVIELKNIHTGEVLSFLTMGKCATFIGTNKSNIHQAIQQHYLIQSKFIVRYTDTPWPNITKDSLSVRRTSGPKSVKLFNVSLKTEETFSSAKDVVKYLTSRGLGSKKIITKSLKHGSQRKVGDFIFKYSDDQTPWKYQ